MNPGRSGREGDIQPVVDQDRHRQRCNEGPGDLNQLSRGRPLQTELQGGDPALDRPPRQIQQIAAGEPSIIGHQHEAEQGR